MSIVGSTSEELTGGCDKEIPLSFLLIEESGEYLLWPFLYYVKERTRPPQTWSGRSGLLSRKEYMKTRKGKDASPHGGRAL